MQQQRVAVSSFGWQIICFSHLLLPDEEERIERKLLGGKEIKKLIEYNKILGYQTNGNNEIQKEPMQ